jgi:eukaryotic-like serine/threonine-protein kinase
LKPANVKITPEGNVKVLDFGLAKALNSNPVSADPLNSPTLTMESTQAGFIMGTAGYMSPEQARGKPVDKRTDIWSFGAVFYELLAGERAFQGETGADTMAAVLKADPDWTRLPTDTPVGIRRLLQRCLQSDPNKRLRDIGDAWNEIDQPADPPSLAKRHWVPWVIAALAVVIAGAAISEWLHVPVALPRTVTRSALTVAAVAGSPALSHDGTVLAYADQAGGISVRMMDQLDGKPIPGAEHGTNPVFSPDGRWVAFLSLPAPYKLQKILVAGGTPITLCDMPDVSRLSWGTDDTILFGSPTGVMRVSAAGGTSQSVTTVSAKNGEAGHYAPAFLPGGDAVLFTIGTGLAADPARLAVLDLNTGTYRILVSNGRAGRYAPSGHLVYRRGETLFAAPFDLKRLTITGPEVPVVEGISEGNSDTFSDSSVLVFTAADGEASSTLEWRDRKGASKPLPEPPHRWEGFALSPDGNFLAGSIRDNSSSPGSNHSDIWVYDLDRRTLSRLTFEGSNTTPVWTPDGRWVTYDSFREGKHGIYRVAADKSGPPELLLLADGSSGVYPSSWTSDGKALLYTQRTEGKSQIWILPAASSGAGSQPHMFAQTSFNESDATISPDGKWVAYDSDESGRYEVYVVPFSGPGSKTQVSTQGGLGPEWSHNGRELIYGSKETNKLMAVDVQTRPVFRAGQPQALFKIVFPGQFEVTPDLNRFLVQRVTEKAATTTFVTITDWFEDLTRRVPVKK